MFERKEEPPLELMNVARNFTTGDVSARRHQASRARVLDRWMAPSRKARMIVGFAVGSLALSTAAFAGLKHAHGPGGHVSMGVGGPVIAATVPSVIEPASTDAPAAKPDPVEAQIQISVEPESAKIFWDSVESDGQIEQKPDDAQHLLRVEAVGYRSKTMKVLAHGKHIKLHVELQPLPIVIGDVFAMEPYENTDEVVEGMRDRFRDCYTEGLALDRTIYGKTTLSLEVKPDGHVRHSEVIDTQGLSSKVTTCLAYVGSDAEFTPTGSPKAGQVQIPLSFGITN